MTETSPDGSGRGFDLGFHRAYSMAQPDFIKYALQDHRKNFFRGPTTQAALTLQPRNGVMVVANRR